MLKEHGHIIELEYEDDAVMVEAEVEPGVAGRLQAFVVGGDAAETVDRGKSGFSSGASEASHMAVAPGVMETSGVTGADGGADVGKGAVGETGGHRRELVGFDPGVAHRSVGRQQVFMRHVQVQLRQRMLAAGAAQCHALRRLSQALWVGLP